MSESEDSKTPPKKKIQDLDFKVLEAPNNNVASDDDDNWGDPADIPDKPRSAADLDEVSNIPVRVSAILGKTRMSVRELVKLNRGAVLELDRKVGEAVDIYLNDRLVARGEVVVVDDALGVTMTEIVKAQKT